MMAKDLLVDENGDLVVDPFTKDLVLIDGKEEVVQRIIATLNIRIGEMVNFDPDQGTDYSNMLGKNYKEDLAASDLTDAILQNIPEVVSVDEINFNLNKESRKLIVTFRVSINTTQSDKTESIEGGFEAGY